jgi:hypothetical protein
LRHTEWGVSLNHVHKWLRCRRNNQLRNGCTIIRRRPSSLKRPLAPSFTQVPCFVTSRLNLLQRVSQRKNGIYLNYKKCDSSVRFMTILWGARMTNMISNFGRITNSSFYTAPKWLWDSHSVYRLRKSFPGENLQESESVNLLPSWAYVKNQLSYNSTPLWVADVVIS